MNKMRMKHMKSLKPNQSGSLYSLNDILMERENVAKAISFFLDYSKIFLQQHNFVLVSPDR